MAVFVCFAATLQTVVNCQESKCADRALTPAVVPSLLQTPLVFVLGMISAASIVLVVLCYIPSLWGGWRTWESFWLFLVAKFTGVFAYKIRKFQLEEALEEGRRSDQAPLMDVFK
jgi:hypothetical protein